MRVLSEKTLIPLSFMIILGGGIVWATMLYFKTEANASALKEMKDAGIDERKEYSGTLHKIDRRLSRIEGRLGIESKDGGE